MRAINHRRPIVTGIVRSHMAQSMDWAAELERFWTFASEAEIVGLWGIALIGIAIFALFAEKRRNKVARIDRIGWVPWTSVFVFSAMIGAGLIALAAKGILTGE